MKYDAKIMEHIINKSEAVIKKNVDFVRSCLEKAEQQQSVPSLIWYFVVLILSAFSKSTVFSNLIIYSIANMRHGHKNHYQGNQRPYQKAHSKKPYIVNSKKPSMAL